MSHGYASDILAASPIPRSGDQRIIICWTDTRGEAHETPFSHEIAAARFEAYLDEDRLAHHRNAT